MTISEHIAEQTSRMARHRQLNGVAILQERSSQALRQAEALDSIERPARILPLAGLSLAVKACFDTQGWTTHAGSKVLANEPPAMADAPLVADFQRLGGIVTSQTNMTEFAFGALGLNPHYGTPTTPLEPSGQRIAGGSTSGGAVAVALGLADVALGSDTSGSVRIPAAFCGVAGFKPSRWRYRDEGMLFLSPSFDVPGFIARDIATLVRVDAAFVPEAEAQAGAFTLRGKRFLVPGGFALDQTDDSVRVAFKTAVEALKNQGAVVIEEDWPELARYGEVAVQGGIIIAEAFTIHQQWLSRSGATYDSRVGPRIGLGESVRASTYIQAQDALAQMSVGYHLRLATYDALLTPTVPILPPTLAELADDANYYRLNRLTFRLTEVANRIDAPSVSLPLGPGLPIGLCLTGHRAGDRSLLHLAQAVQAALEPSL